MSQLGRSELVWGCWVGLFLLLELAAFFRVAPWDTLSQTSWLDEREYPILRTVLFGFLIGLAVHIRFETGLLRSTGGGMLVAVALNFLW